MNRLKFNEGGQPVYLDDLRLLQDNSKAAVDYLLSAITRGQPSLFLEQPTYRYIEDDVVGPAIEVSKGTAYLYGDFVSWDKTIIPGIQSLGDLYLCICETDSDRRFFDDGQQRACLVYREGYISNDHVGASKYIGLSGTWDIFDYLQDAIGYKPNQWRNVAVQFANGYKGTVRYKEMDDCYRVYINIRSTNTNAISGSIFLFSTDSPILGYFYSPRTACIQTENGVMGCSIHGFEGQVYLDVNLPFVDADCAADVPVKIIFEIPK